MSIELMSLVWRRSPEKGSALLVHLALADEANDEGWCYPSFKMLSIKARTSNRGTRKIVDGLIARGWLDKIRGNARTNNRYRLKTEKLLQPRTPPEGEKPAEAAHFTGERRSPLMGTQFPSEGNPVPLRGEPSSLWGRELGSLQRGTQFPSEGNPVPVRGEPSSRLMGTPFPSDRNAVPAAPPPYPPGEGTGAGKGGGVPPYPPNPPETANGGGGGEPPPESPIQKQMRETLERQDEQRRLAAEAAAAAAALVRVLPEPETAEGAWGQLIEFWNGEFENASPPVALPPRTFKAWNRMGGAERFSTFAGKPGEIAYALAHFVKMWNSLAAEFRDKVSIR